MITRYRRAAGLTVALLAAYIPAARADLNASLLAYQAHQYGVSASARFGTVVTANTNLGNIWAHASHSIECSDPNIRPAITGSNGWSDNGFYGPKRITVTSPTTYPTVQGLPGWNAVKGGTRFDCVFSYEGIAKTSLLAIGAGGTSVPFGGDYWESAGSQTFSMIKPGTFGTGGCIP
jgi:hypothetical protein